MFNSVPGSSVSGCNESIYGLKYRQFELALSCRLHVLAFDSKRLCRVVKRGYSTKRYVAGYFLESVDWNNL